jgi:predicted permease
MKAILLALLSRLRFVFGRDRLGDETSEELKLHHELLTARYIDNGMSRDDARDAATRQLGNVTRVREDIHDMNSVRWLDVLVQDVRYAIRMAARTPAYAAVVIATMALGIGANTAILSVVYGVLLQPLPYVKPELIYSVEIIVPERRDQIPSIPTAIQTYQEWQRAQTTFSGISALRPWEASLTDDGEPERLGGARVSANFFSLLGVAIAHGRGFAPEEEQLGRERVVVISDGLWRRRYGSDPTVIGRTIVLNGEGHRVVGVASPTLLVPTGNELHPLVPFAPRVDIWKPIAPTADELKNESWDHGVLVRLPDGATQEQGRQQLETILNEWLRTEAPEVRTEASIRLVPVREIFAGNVRLRLLLVLAASALLLLTACASVANVVLARVASRANEFATRIALGAGRARIVSQSLTETIVLALAGGSIGAIIAAYGVDVLAASGPEDLRLLEHAHLQTPLLLFALLVSLLTGAVCGIVPAWRAYRRDPGVALQETARTSVGARRAERSRQILVGVQVALATVLLASAGLLLHSFVKLMRADRGYDVQRVLAVDLSLFGQRYSSPTARGTFYAELLDRVRSLPGIVQAGGISHLPAASAKGASPVIFHATDTDFQGLVLTRPVAMVRSVTEGYFVASGTALRAGRFLRDDEPGLVAVISESLASRMWPGEPSASIVGRQLRQGNVSAPLISVVGVVADEHPGGLDREPPPAIYRPYAQWASGPMTLVIKTEQEPATLARAVRAEIRRIDPNLPISAMRTMREIVSSAVAQRRFQMALTSLFALVALFLGAVGLYGVLSYAVARRTREIGLRMALGALRTTVMRAVFTSGMRPVFIGLAVGMAGTIATARALRHVLYQVSPTDPLSLGTVVLVMLLTSGIACYLPARRAAALEPIIALRHD